MFIFVKSILHRFHNKTNQQVDNRKGRDNSERHERHPSVRANFRHR